MHKFVVVAVSFVLLVGCTSKRATLSGKVIYKGQPVNNVSLHLYPNSDNAKETPDVILPVSQEGTFSTTGIKPGEYKVVVETQQVDDMAMKMKNMKGPKAEEAKKILEQNKSQSKPTIDFPKKYQNILTSDLTCNITGGQQEIVLELK